MANTSVKKAAICVFIMLAVIPMRDTYISIQWNKAVTEIFGPTVPHDGQPHNHLVYGTIDRSADAWEILLDAARLLKDPSAYPGSPFHPFVFLSGTFTPFSDDELLTRDDSRYQYVQRVNRAANDLAAKGYITNEDRKALIAAAQDEPLPAAPG